MAVRVGQALKIISAAFGFLLLLSVAGPSSASVGSQFCPVLRYCSWLYDKRDPTSQFHSEVYPTVVARRATSLFNITAMPSTLRERARGVGRLAIRRRSISNPGHEYASWCTAAIISDDFAITAAHCLPGINPGDEYVVAAKLLVGYVKLDNDEGTTTYPVINGTDAGCPPNHPPEAVCPVAGNWAGTDDSDFAVFRIGRSPDGRSAAQAYAAVTLRTMPLDDRALLFVPQHPYAVELLGGTGFLGEPINTSMRAHHVTTLDMSSGAPVLDLVTGEMVGVHVGLRTGTCQNVDDVYNRVGCENRFMTLEAIAARSPIVTSLLARQNARQPPVGPEPVQSSAAPKSGWPQEPQLSDAPFATLVARAQAGDAQANWELGVKAEYADSPRMRALLRVPDYQQETGVAGGVATALTYYRRAAEAGHTAAQVDLGSFYAEGVEVTQNPARATSLFTAAANKGDARAMGWLAIMHRRGDATGSSQVLGDQFLRRAAAAGSPWAQNELGFHYLYGQGGERDVDQAVRLFSLAAAQGLPEAENHLADRFRLGEGVPKDLQLAEYFYRRALNGGYAGAAAGLYQLEPPGI